MRDHLEPASRSNRKRRVAATLLSLALAAVFVTSAYGAGLPLSQMATAESEPARDRVTCRPARGETTTIATAKLIIECNATDNDIGVHGAFDDHGWSELCVYDPKGR